METIKQLQLDGMKDPLYLGRPPDLADYPDLIEYFDSAVLFDRPEDDPSIAEDFFRVGEKTYELFLVDKYGGHTYEVYGPGLDDGDLYVVGLDGYDEDSARAVAGAVLRYAGGALEPGTIYDLAA